MSYLELIWNNKLFMTGVCAWAVGQILKTIIHAVLNHKFDAGRLIGDGGMPSCHSATVTSMAVKCAMIYGLDSPYFAIMGILAIIVMHDAMGVRLETGKQAKLLNTLIELLDAKEALDQEKKLKELVGHTPLQVIAGSILGIIIAFAVFR